MNALVLRVQCRVHLDGVGASLVLKPGGLSVLQLDKPEIHLPASLQLDLKSDHGTMCPPLGEKEPYVRRVKSSSCCLMKALLGWAWRGWGARWEGKEIKERETRLWIFSVLDSQGIALSSPTTGPLPRRSLLWFPLEFPCVVVPCCCAVHSPHCHVGGPLPRTSVAIHTLMTFKKVFSPRQINSDLACSKHDSFVSCSQMHSTSSMFLMRTVEGSPFRLSGLETGSQPRQPYHSSAVASPSGKTITYGFKGSALIPYFCLFCWVTSSSPKALGLESGGSSSEFWLDCLLLLSMLSGP